MRLAAAGPRLLAMAALAIAVVVLGACASGSPPADWQLNARSALDHAVAAQLRGDARAAQADFDRARAELARTGRADLLARAELLRCAADVASLAFGPCTGFERLRADAAAPELAYAAHLAGQALAPANAALLPPTQRAVTAATGDATTLAALQAEADPLSRLVAAGVLLQGGRASPAVVVLAVDTASAQGWRRPLLAWLGVQLQRARQAGDVETAARLQRRIDLVAPPP